MEGATASDREKQLQEEEELQLALAISASEAESQRGYRQGSGPASVPRPTVAASSPYASLDLEEGDDTMMQYVSSRKRGVGNPSAPLESPAMSVASGYSGARDTDEADEV